MHGREESQANNFAVDTFIRRFRIQVAADVELGQCSYARAQASDASEEHRSPAREGSSPKQEGRRFGCRALGARGGQTGN
jgi:hypothetical protein